MCHRDAAVWSTKLLGCVSDIVVHTQLSKATSKEQQQCKFSASATNAIDIYKRLCIIYFCDEREATQVASITFAQDGIRLVNLGASAGDEALPTSVFLSRAMFVLYNVYPPEGAQEVQILVNFSTLMDFLECALANVTQEDLLHPLHVVLDNWLYISLQRTPTICDLDKAMSTSLNTAIQRFCLIPTECFGGSLDEESSQIVPRSGDQLMRESDEMMDNTILMLHPLNAKHLDPSYLFPFTSAHTLAKFSKQQHAKAPPALHPPAHASKTAPLLPPAPIDIDSPATSAGAAATGTGDTENETKGDNEGPPRKRLKTTSEQISLLEEWFQKEPLPPRKVREEMVQRLDGSVSLRQLEVWFQNRRAKQKKAEARALAQRVPSNSTPPSSPSPPTTPPPASLSMLGMSPNPSTLIPSTSPSITPRRSTSKSARHVNSQGVPKSPSLLNTPSPTPTRTSSPSTPQPTPQPLAPVTSPAITQLAPQLATQFVPPPPPPASTLKPPVGAGCQ